MCWPFNGSYNQALLCVFDGHGSKGERASEFCMRTIPDLLEADSTHCTDPTGCLSRNVIKTDEMLLGDAELGRFAMTCGTTSTVVYFNGPDCYVACSGRLARRAACAAGEVVAEDLSDDHKPDLPQEKQRIIAQRRDGDGRERRPPCARLGARAHRPGHVALHRRRRVQARGRHPGPRDQARQNCRRRRATAATATSSSLSPPTVCGSSSRRTRRARSSPSTRPRRTRARRSCSRRRCDGSGTRGHRDDITCIVAYFPFLEDSWPEEPVDESETAADDEATSAGHVFINMGSSGIEVKDALPEEDEEGEGGGEKWARTASRRGGCRCATRTTRIGMTQEGADARRTTRTTSEDRVMARRSQRWRWSCPATALDGCAANAGPEICCGFGATTHDAMME